MAMLDEATAIPAGFRERLRHTLDRATAFAERVAAEGALEDNARKAASGLYHITSAVLMAREASRAAADARRALYARLVLDHRLGVQDPLAVDANEDGAIELLLSDRDVSLSDVVALLA